MTPKNLIDQHEGELVSAATNGNLEAFNQLVLHYQDMAYNLANTLLGDADSAEDVAQESFIKAFQNVHKFRGGSFRAWILKIVVNTSYDLLRKSKRRSTQPLFPEDEEGEEFESPIWLADPTASVQEIVEQKQAAERIVQYLNELPDAYRTVLIMIDLQELDYQEAAEVLQVPLGTVKSRLARARLHMKAKLTSEPEFERYNVHTIELV